MSADDGDQFSIESFAAVLSSRASADGRIARAIGFGWLCGGCALATCLIGAGAAVALWGYSVMQSATPAAEITAAAIAHAFERAQIKTSVTGTMGLAENSRLSLASNQSVKIEEGSTIKLDPASTIRVVGDLKLDVPQPSKQQLQLDATSGSKELPFTKYTIFKYTKFGAGEVVTGWNFELSDPSRPTIQRCYYEEVVAGGISASQTLAFDGAPRPPSPLAKLSFDFDSALTNCSWFSGS
jgi:hypothetical protein